MHRRFRANGLFRHLLEIALQCCIDEGLVGGHSFGADARLIPTNTNQTRGIETNEGFRFNSGQVGLYTIAQTSAGRRKIP